MEQLEKEYLERIIQLQKDQLERYHEYTIIALSNTKATNSSRNIGTFSQDDYIPLFKYIEDNLKELSIEKIFEYLETETGIISLIDHSLVPDKTCMQFQIHSNNYIKYKNNNDIIVNEYIYDFSSKVCVVIHDYCKPHVHISNQEVEQDISEKKKEENVLDNVCDVAMQRAKVLQLLKYGDSQMRLIKKVFSGLKSK